MQKVYSKKASITVFLTLLLLLSASFFFALLETARLKGLGTKADIVSDAALESVFAEYQKEIYENYGLLMLDCAYGSGNFAIENVEKRLQEKNLNNLKQSEKELYGINLTECKMTGYQLLTDDGGNVFRHLAARTAKREALVQEVDDFAEEIQQKESLEQENGTVEERLEEANKTIEEVEQAKQAENTEEKVGDISAQKPQEEVKNHVEDANQWKKSAVLSLVVRDESQLSNKAIALEHTLEHRQKETGNLPVQGAILEELWFVKYLETHMGSYQQISSNHALDYEWEYILNGESSDRDNLKETVKSLIMIREIANMGYLIQDQQKCIEAEELAVALMGWSMNPPVVDATKWGILAAWAYSESILDVRALLEGRRIAWIKNAEQWTTGINQTGEAVDGFAMAKDCENGWDYLKYLQFLICMKKDSAVNYRSMDIIEVNTNAMYGKSIQMDHMMTGCESRVSYEAEPLFWNMITIQRLGMETFQIDRCNQYTYF
ncbi:MAG: DUF5702 domain-containing protein [Lachnospiraceae bacterium]|nr:DUF5702 domain-containing protein [Lachnospiraceae bacterium]